MRRALASDADSVIFDWEDSVVRPAKQAARRATADALAMAPRGAGPSRWVRINALGSAEIDDDLRALPAAHIDGVVLPKCCGPRDVERLGELLSTTEREHARTNPLGIVGIVTETAASVLALTEFRAPIARLRGLMWGAEDLTADLGIASNRDSEGRYRRVFLLARYLALLAAGACECDAIDTVDTEFRNLEILATQCRVSRLDGFRAKAAIHPAQVPLINDAFAPSAAEREWAEQVVAALSSGEGVAVVDGKMVDAPHLRLARRLLSERTGC
jgi:citrate lyase subunit beta/citryl-CoA lyase